jgi:hypothetical protein
MHRWEWIQTVLQVKAVIDRLKAIEQDTLTPREREVWQESVERAYEQAASLLAPDLLEEGVGRKAGRRVGGKDHAAV